MQLQYIATKLKLITVEPVLFCYMFVIFLETNALQELIFVKSCMKLNRPENISECSYELKQNMTDALTEATKWSKYNNAFLFFFTFISAFYVGSWSDRLGRKLPMLVPPIGTVFAATVNALLSYFMETHVAYFFLSAIISGITFGVVGIIATTYGYISDFTHEESRTKRIVILESMIFLGGMVGSYVGGVFLKHVHFDSLLNNFVQLFMFEAVLSTAIVVYIVVRIPRSDLPSLEGPLSFSRLFSLRHVLDSIKTIFRFREDGKRKKVILMLIALFFIYFGSVVQVTLSYYYVKDLGWPFEKYANFHSMQLGVQGVALILLLPFLFHFLHIPDHFVGILGLLSRIAGFALFGLSTNDVMLYSCIALYMFSEFPVPALRSMLSKTVSADEKGKIFAVTTLIMNLCYLLGSYVLMTIFTAVSSFHGLCFELVAAMQVISLMIFVYLYLTRRTYITMYESIENEDGSIIETCNVVASDGSVN